MCSCGGVQEILDFRRKLEMRFGPATTWQKGSEPLRLLISFKETKKDCIGGSKAYGN